MLFDTKDLTDSRAQKSQSRAQAISGNKIQIDVMVYRLWVIITTYSDPIRGKDSIILILINSV